MKKVNVGFGPTVYEFPVDSLTSGKRPKLCKSTTRPRGSVKDILIRNLRPWQRKAFLKLRNDKLQLIKAFCGSGKTTLGMVLALWDLIVEKRKQLILVPQNHIGDGYCRSGVYYVPDLGYVNLGKTPTDLCEDSDKKVDKLINFLKRDFKYDNAVGLVKSEKDKNQYVVEGDTSIFVATHQCFAAAVNKIRQMEENGVDDQGNIVEKGFFDKCFSDLGLTIDEAHHIKSGDSSKEEKIEEEFYNRLGIITDVLLEKHQKNNIRICLTTATFFRGDQGIIVSDKNLEKFNKFELDFLEHFETLDIEHVFVNFEEYLVDPIDQIVQNIENELDERHLIIVPAGGKTGDKWRKTDLDLSRLLGSLREMLVRKGFDPDKVILNLVNKETQKSNKSILLKEPKERYEKDKPENSKIKIVITCMLGREGTDWCPCSRLHNSSIELNSTTLAIQTLGRLFRKFEDKNKVGIIYYIKNFENLESSEKREYITHRVNAMLGLMLIDDLFHPIMLPALPTSSHEGEKRAYKKKKKKFIRLSDVYDFEDFEEIKHEIISLQSSQSDFEEEYVEDIIKRVIANYKKKAAVDDSDIVAAFKIFLLRAKSEILRSRGIDISYIKEAGFDKIVEKYKLGGTFWEGHLTPAEFRKLRQIAKKIFWSTEQYLEIKDNTIKFLSKKIGKIVDPNNKGHETIIREIVADFCNFHKAYNYVSKTEGQSVPTKRLMADQLNISMNVLQEKIIMLNQIAPKGYKFFDKKSKITEKISPVSAA